MILEVDPSSAVPPYEQIRARLTGLITSGALIPGTRLPTIRQLAGDLGVAPGTVGRAYHELEQSGLVTSRGRHGTRVAARLPAALEAVQRPLLDEAAAVFVAAALRSGAGLAQALDAVRRVFGEVQAGVSRSARALTRT
jgi:GntR family transcriptional regulator